MALSAAQKTRIAEIYYFDARNRRSLTDQEVAFELMSIILANPSAAQKTAITNFLTARKTASETFEATIQPTANNAIATEDTLQSEITTLITNL